mgnify:CR=1 FL=1
MLSKADFITKYAERNNISKRKAKAEILRFIDSYKDLTYQSGGIDIYGFMKSEIVTQKGRRYVHPLTKDECFTADREIVKISVKPTFREMKDIEDEDTEFDEL